jgi:GGDEF domain-containing protein
VAVNAAGRLNRPRHHRRAFGRHLEEQLQRLAAASDQLSCCCSMSTASSRSTTPATSAAEAAGLGERVRREVAAAPVSLEDGPLHVTASIGVASGAEDGWEGLVRRADTGL